MSKLDYINDITKLHPGLFQAIYKYFPQKENFNIEALYGIFLDQQIDLLQEGSNNKLILSRNHLLPYLVENMLSVNNKIEWLWENYYPEFLPFYVSMSEHSLICLNDSWCFLGWANRIKNLFNQKRAKNLILIHYDYHDDLMSPLLIKKNNSWLDPITNQAFDTFNMWSVFSSICSGSIGIGSFIIPLAFLTEILTVVHIKQGQNFENHDLLFCETDVNDLYIDRGTRLSFKYKAERPMGELRYYKTSSLNEIYNKLELKDPILMHIDMDYFNNRLDGSTSKRPECFNPSIADQFDEVSKVIQDIQHIKNQIVHTSIALSPGFYPSEFWDKIPPKLLQELSRIGLWSSGLITFPDFS